MNTNFIWIILIIVCNTPFLLAQGEQERLQALQTGRQYFHQAVKDEEKIDSARVVFKQLMTRFPDYEGRATTYLGALTALEGKHAFWIYTKYKKVVHGLEMMDRGVGMDPDDIESRFIRGTTTYYLPGLFGRKESTQADFAFIRKHLPSEHLNYDPDMVRHVINFILDNITLAESDRSTLRNLKSEVTMQ